jgi:hypothetical protein
MTLRASFRTGQHEPQRPGARVFDTDFRLREFDQLDRVGYGVHPKGWQKQTLSLKCSHVNAAASAVEHFSETVLSIDRLGVAASQEPWPCRHLRSTSFEFAYRGRTLLL